MDIEHLSDRILSRIDDLRDRSAEAMKADGESVFRELSQLNDRLDGVEDRLGDRLDELASAQTDRMGAVLAAAKRTSWPRRILWLTLGAAAGAAATYLADPDRGRSRRSQLTDQLTSAARDVGSEVAGQAEFAADRAKGAVIESAKDALPEDVPDDPKLLEQRIRSHVLGGRNDVDDVVLRVDAPGRVALKGTVPSAETERSLVVEVAEVEGVVDVTSELSVRAG
jgi:gas vesicle protein